MHQSEAGPLQSCGGLPLRRNAETTAIRPERRRFCRSAAAARFPASQRALGPAQRSHKAPKSSSMASNGLARTFSSFL